MAEQANEKQTFTDVDEFMTAVWGSRPSRNSADLVHYDRIRDRLTGLKHGVNGAIGELVLVIQRSLEPSSSMMMPHNPRDLYVDSRYKLCRVSEPGLLITFGCERGFDEAVVSISATAFVAAWRGMSGWMKEKRDGCINDDIIYSFWMYLNEPLEGTPWHPYGGPEKRLEVIAGNNAVFDWAEQENEELLLRDMARMLDYEVTFPALTKRIERDRDAIANDIESLWPEYFALAKVVADLIKRFGEDDASLATWRQRAQLKAVKEQLSTDIAKLIEYGINDAMPNLHLIRHVAQKLGITLP
jgi:hypothetical protein